MRILNLEISNIGGIRYNIKLEPNGDNFLVYGPNGSGKSSIVNAIDFLLTGKISRMAGEGTTGINFKKHGIHISAKPEEGYVKALIKLTEIEEPIEIKRSFKDPNELIVHDIYKNILEPVIELASRSQYILTKREILKFVTAKNSDRGKKIQDLLKLKEVEDINANLKKINNDFRKNFEFAERNLETCKDTVRTTMDEKDPSSEDILKFINHKRSILGGKSIDILKSSIVKEGLLPPGSHDEHRVNIELLNQDLDKIRDIISKTDLKSKDADLRRIIYKISSDPLLAESVARSNLASNGLKLLDSTGKCPLCNTSWVPSELKQNLENQLKVYQEGSKDLHLMKKSAQKIIETINSLNSSINEILKAIDKLDIEKAFPEFKEWNNNLMTLKTILEDLDKYPDPRFTPEKIETLCAPKDLKNILDKLISCAKKHLPKPTLEQTSWDILTRLEENFKSMENAVTKVNSTATAYNRSKVLYVTFSEKRENVLNQLFEKISVRFVELYRIIHHGDESDFDAIMKINPSGVDLKVGFHGKGMNPPHALHSEGHQDSMGICLYLALSEQITQGYIHLTILDDVMASVDADHRRGISRIIATHFKDRQILITTHDPIWAEQLQKHHVVTRKNMYKFYNWTLESGPKFKQSIDSWEQIRKDIDDDEIPAAAAKLRRTSEEYFSSVCESLQAETKHKNDRGYDLGELLPPAISKYKKFLKNAKISASTWNRNEDLKILTEIDKEFSKIIVESEVDKWTINANVHYNNWANFTPNDFKPVVNSFEKLFNIFKCKECGRLIHLSMNGYFPDALRCDCGSINWNLKEKPKE